MKCPTCGTENDASAAFCDHCGASLTSTTPLPSGGAPPTKPQPATPPPPPETVSDPVVPCRLALGSRQIVAPLKKEIVVGRADAATAWNPDVDLAPYGGTKDAGVSRKHVKIAWQKGWVLEDLNSTNGTYLRGQRLVPGKRTPIRNGEVLQVGKLQITFFTQ